MWFTSCLCCPPARPPRSDMASLASQSGNVGTTLGPRASDLGGLPETRACPMLDDDHGRIAEPPRGRAIRRWHPRYPWSTDAVAHEAVIVEGDAIQDRMVSSSGCRVTAVHLRRRAPVTLRRSSAWCARRSDRRSPGNPAALRRRDRPPAPRGPRRYARNPPRSPPPI